MFKSFDELVENIKETYNGPIGLDKMVSMLEDAYQLALQVRDTEVDDAWEWAKKRAESGITGTNIVSTLYEGYLYGRLSAFSDANKYFTKQKPKKEHKPKYVDLRFKIGNTIRSRRNPNICYQVQDIVLNELGEYDYKCRNVGNDEYRGRVHDMTAKVVDENFDLDANV